MTAFVIGFAATAGPVLAWHLYVVARRYDAPEHPSGSFAPPAADGPCDRTVRLGRVTTTAARYPTREDHRP